MQKHCSFVLLVNSIVTNGFYFPDPLYQLLDLGFYLFFSTLNTNLVHFVGLDCETNKVFYLGNWEDMLHVHIYVMMVFNEIFSIFWSYAFNPCLFLHRSGFWSNGSGWYQDCQLIILFFCFLLISFQNSVVDKHNNLTCSGYLIYRDRMFQTCMSSVISTILEFINTCNIALQSTTPL